MTRDEARKAFADSGLIASSITKDQVEDLRDKINAEMEASGLISGSYRATEIQFSHRFAAIRCKSHYFDDREAVTFNEDGFVGFAGWADDKNIQPILAGFTKWLTEKEGRR